MENKIRNYGIDLLRLISMYLIVILHILGQGGVLRGVQNATPNYWIAWLFEVITYGSVNIFAVITGFVSYDTSKLRLDRLLLLWIQVAFYTIVITCIFWIAMPKVRTFTIILNALFPITRNQYWYITAYFGLCIVTPILSIGIKNIDKKTFDLILSIIFIAMMVLPTAFTVDPYHLHEGFSMLWLVLLFLVGGYIRKYKILEMIKPKIAFAIGILMVFITIGSKFVFEMIGLYGNKLIFYTSPTIVIASIAVFLYMGNVKLPLSIKRFVEIFSPAALGVYLIHVHPLIWKYILLDRFVKITEDSSVVMTVKIVLLSAGIFSTCLLLERIRIKLFEKLKLPEFCKLINNG